MVVAWRLGTEAENERLHKENAQMRLEAAARRDTQAALADADVPVPVPIELAPPYAGYV